MNITQIRATGLAFVMLCGTAGAMTIPDFSLPQQTFFKQTKASQGGRKVFAWYMVCCGAFGGNTVPHDDLVAEYKAEIKMARSMGIDGFGLDMMQSNDEYEKDAAAMYEAARSVSPDFKLFFEFDNGDAAKHKVDYAELIRTYANHPNQMKVDGRPLVCAYAADYAADSADASVKWWVDTVIQPLAKDGIKIHFVPTTFGRFGLPKYSWISREATDLEIAGWGDVEQGESVWMIQLSPIGGGIATLENYASALHAKKQTWMSTVSTHYWVASANSIPGWCWSPGQASPPACPNGTYFEHAGGMGLAAQWASVIDVQHPDWVIMLTWNDYNESYMEPVDDYRKYPNGTAQAPLGWYKPQAGMDELNRYYIQWYKTGKEPRITRDGLFYAYRTTPTDAKASLDTRAPVRAGNGPIEDVIYVTTALTAPAELRVISGGVESRTPVAAGIAHTKTPFHVGAQSFSIWRGGIRIVTTDGEPIVDQIKLYDYWPTTGYAESPASTGGQ